MKKLTSCKLRSLDESLLVSKLSALLLASLEIVNPGPHVYATAACVCQPTGDG